MRRIHRKSRYGCKTCKRRRVKCDEARPSCNNCSSSRRTCSYLGLPAAEAFGPQGASTATSKMISEPSPPFTTCVKSLGVPGAIAHVPAEHVFTILHMELLHHFESYMSTTSGAGPCVEGVISKVTVKCAFSVPYLMDQVLAISALHMSTVRPHQRHMYRRQATMLQIRALASFNWQRRLITDETCLPIFLFTSLLCQQALFEAFSVQDDIYSFLNDFAACLMLYRGICTLTSGGWWSTIEHHLRNNMDSAPPMEIPDGLCASSPTLEHKLASDGVGSTTPPKPLGEANSDPRTPEACSDATERARKLIATQEGLPADCVGRVTVVHAWLAGLELDYIELLRQYKPAAIAVLAHFAVLLGGAKHCWVFGNTAHTMSNLVESHLGSAVK